MEQAKDIIKQVKKIELTTKQLVEGLITGNYHSIFKGQGVEFSEIRDYRAGDDIRTIDWKVTARFNHPFIKEFIEERDIQVFFAIDMSGSSSFGNNVSKRKKALEVAASLMFAALHNKDNVGVFLFTDKVEEFIPARKGRKHILKIISKLVSYEPKSTNTDINKSLVYISKIVKKRSIIFVISDFISNDFSRPLKILKKKNDVIALRVIDNREREIPDVGLIELEDEETGEQILVDTSDKNFRENYKKIVDKYEKNLMTSFKKIKVDAINIFTDEPYEIPIKKFFKTRLFRVVR